MGLSVSRNPGDAHACGFVQLVRACARLQGKLSQNRSRPCCQTPAPGPGFHPQAGVHALKLGQAATKGVQVPGKSRDHEHDEGVKLETSPSGKRSKHPDTHAVSFGIKTPTSPVSIHGKTIRKPAPAKSVPRKTKAENTRQASPARRST